MKQTTPLNNNKFQLKKTIVDTEGTAWNDLII